MLNVTHAESAILGGSATFKKWLAKFTEQWQEPAMNAVVLRWWDTMPPDVKEQAKAQFPTEFALIEERIEAVRDREE
jgi:hypothetical protein